MMLLFLMANFREFKFCQNAHRIVIALCDVLHAVMEMERYFLDSVGKLKAEPHTIFLFPWLFALCGYAAAFNASKGC